MKRWGLYEWSVILFFAVVPCAALLIEWMAFPDAFRFGSAALKWFTFSGVGLRLGSAGVKQVVQPQFTAKSIFGAEGAGAASVVREIGLANISLSVAALVSLFVPMFRVPAAVTGGLYFGLAGLLHVFRRRTGAEERFAMISDLFIFVMLLALLFLNGWQA